MTVGVYKSRRFSSYDEETVKYLNGVYDSFKSSDDKETYKELKESYENPEVEITPSDLWVTIVILDIDCNVNGLRTPSIDPYIHVALKELRSSDSNKYMRLRVLLANILAAFDPESESFNIDTWAQRVDEFCDNFTLETNGVRLGRPRTEAFRDDFGAVLQAMELEEHYRGLQAVLDEMNV